MRSGSPFGSSSSIFAQPPSHVMDHVTRESPSSSAFYNVSGMPPRSAGSSMMYGNASSSAATYGNNGNANPDMGLFDMSAFNDFSKMDTISSLNNLVGVNQGPSFTGRRLTQDSPSPNVMMGGGSGLNPNVGSFFSSQQVNPLNTSSTSTASSASSSGQNPVGFAGFVPLNVPPPSNHVVSPAKPTVAAKSNVLDPSVTTPLFSSPSQMTFYSESQFVPSPSTSKGIW